MCMLEKLESKQDKLPIGSHKLLESCLEFDANDGTEIQATFCLVIMTKNKYCPVFEM